ncbi:MAG: response regulator transcription factor [Chitinophagaceae bacterium]|nr:response regulator transcription factor [Chitinophagaceae bacterium]
MIRTILIDDERNSRESLRKKILQYCPEIVIQGEYANGLEGLDAIGKETPDLVFLDIEMPLMNGFSMLSELPVRGFDVIFTTAFNQYAIDAIRFSALDYLVKPVDVQDLVAAVKRVKEKSVNSNAFSQLELLQQFIGQKNSVPEKIAVATSNGFEILEIRNMLFLEAEGNYTRIHLVNAKPLVASKTLKEFEEILPSSVFCRIHNASLVNISFIVKYNKGEGGQVVLTNGTVLDVARRRKDELLQLIASFAKKV